MAGKEDSQANFVTGLVDFLKEHRAVLHTLPEMYERLIDMVPNEPETQNFDGSREDEQKILSKRKKAELLRSYKSMQEELAIKDKRITQLEKELKEKTMELEMRAYLSEKQVKKDQRKVEDTVALNRPSDVENHFAAFFDEERVDACEKMQAIYGSDEEIDVAISYPRLACMIFEAAYEQVKETKDAVLNLFKVITKNMIDLAPKMGQEYSLNAKRMSRAPYKIPFGAAACSPHLEYPTDALDALMLSLRQKAHICNLEPLEQGVKEKIKEKWLLWLTMEKSCKFSYSEFLLRKLDTYIKECIRLTWRMVTQVPPMEIEYQSSILKDIHRNLGFHGSPEMCSNRSSSEQTSGKELEIACYIWPVLLDGGGKVIRAGEVFCKVMKDDTVI